MTEGQPRPIYRDTEHERMFERGKLNLKEAHERAKGVIAENEIPFEGFRGLYDEKVLERDTAEVKRLKGLFETPDQPYADILEAVVCEHGELSDWFGSRSQVMKTNRFDDYINKLDMIVETAEEGGGFSHLALGVDVTTGGEGLHKKFEGIKAKIDNGELGEIKYFHSDRQHFTGRKSKVPQVVVGIEMEHVEELGLLWMNRRNKELAEHPVQMTILEEIALQLKTFAEYARRIGKDEAASVLETELAKIRQLLDEKKERGIVGIKADKVFDEIRRNLLSFR